MEPSGYQWGFKQIVGRPDFQKEHRCKSETKAYFFLHIYHRQSNRERHPNDFLTKMTDDKLSKFTRSISIENTSYQ